MSEGSPGPIWKGPSGPIPTRAELGLNERAPKTSTGLLSSILNSTADGLLVIDRNGRIVRIEHGFLDEHRSALEERIRSLVGER